MIKHIFSILFFIFMLSLNVTAQSQKAYIKAGNHAYGKKDFVSALEFYKQALEFDEQDVSVLFKLAETHRELFNFETALSNYRTAIINDKEHTTPELFLKTAEVLRYIGKPEDARFNIQIYHQLIYANDSLSRKSIAASSLIELSGQMINDSVPVSILNVGETVNSSYSDFASQQLNDSLFYFSSLKFPSKASKSDERVSKILVSRKANGAISKPVLLGSEINQPAFHNCNASITSDHKLMVFSRCNYNDANELICALYESKFINGKWQTAIRLNDAINIAGFTSTQASITTNLAEGYILFFVSDRVGGKGQLDIWKSLRDASGNYSAPQNMQTINTAGNEITPVFDRSRQTLYFSTDSLPGAGNFDVFKNIFINNQPTVSVNIGYPFNTGYNDIYFTPGIINEQKGYLTSNRPGSGFLAGSYPCYDIFSYQVNEPIIAVAPKDSIEPLNTTFATENMETVLYSLKKQLPLKLYFDNDHPDPRTRKTTTHLSYDQLYNQYFQKLENYISGFAGRGSSVNEDAQSSMQNFFTASLQFNYKKLNLFAEELIKALHAQDTIELSVSGYASPLAESQYNVNLSQRRIYSLVNYLQQWNSGLLNPYLQSKQLTIVQQAAGESLAPNTVSDKAADQANSVFNPKAAEERRIEITDIIIQRAAH